MRAIGPSRRASLGFIAAAIFHQGAWALLYFGGLMPPPYPMTPVPPWGVPQTIDFCFWGALYGAAYGLVALVIQVPWGIGVGLITSLPRIR